MNGRTLTECNQGAFWDDGKRPFIGYLGFDWTEGHRLADIRREKPQWRWEAPMLEAPIWDKCRMEREARAIGLEIPLLYTLGFPHNNCGGRRVRAGISHFVHLYRVLPERFLEWERSEEHGRARISFGAKFEPLSVLKDRRGGQTKSLWLSDLRKRIEAGDNFLTMIGVEMWLRRGDRSIILVKIIVGSADVLLIVIACYEAWLMFKKRWGKVR